MPNISKLKNQFRIKFKNGSKVWLNKIYYVMQIALKLRLCRSKILLLNLTNSQPIF